MYPSFAKRVYGVSAVAETGSELKRMGSIPAFCETPYHRLVLDKMTQLNICGFEVHNNQFHLV